MKLRRMSLILNLLLSSAILSFGQNKALKPPIDFQAIENWETIGADAIISSDGKFVAYTIENKNHNQKTLYLQSTTGPFKKSFPNQSATAAQFTADVKYFLLRSGADSLTILSLSKDEVNYRKNIQDIRVFKSKSNYSFAYTSKNTADNDQLSLINLNTGKIKELGEVKQYIVSKNEQRLYLTRTSKLDTDNSQLSVYNMSTNREQIIWRGKSPENLIFDEEEQQLCFLSPDSNGHNQIYYYKLGQLKADLIASSAIDGLGENDEVANIESFIAGNSNLFIYLRATAKPTDPPVQGNLKVWSYDDAFFDGFVNQRTEFKAILFLGKNPHVQKLEDEHTEAWLSKGKDYFLQVTGDRMAGRNFWNRKLKRTFIGAVSAKDGVSWPASEQYPIFQQFNELRPPEQSFSGRYVLFYKDDTKLVSYDVITRETKEIAPGLRVDWTPPDGRFDDVFTSARPMISWIDGTDTFLAYGGSDIWQLDASGTSKPINLTNGYGLAHGISFRPYFWNDDHKIVKGRKIMLDACNARTKEVGLFSAIVGKRADPTKLYFGNEHILGNQMSGSINNGSLYLDPIKAANSDAYVILKQSAEKSPNLFFTKDFKNLRPITDIYPEKDYNWLSAELMHWKGSNFSGESVLFKPENFDPTKKYPVIIHYYQEITHLKNNFQKPELSVGDVTVSYMVSQGYLVYVIDMFFQKGHTVESAYESLMAATDELVKKPYVDNTNMAITGHSFGGYQTNYFITQTNRFKAAFVGAGVANLLSKQGEYNGGGNPPTDMNEIGQNRMKYSLWERPDLYIKNSPVFQLDKVKTPVLIFHSKNDRSVYFQQAMELYGGLYRMGKTAWLLEYKNDQGHTVREKKNQEDLTLRMTQFFDYYLKGKPAPLWMLDGLSAAEKSSDTGLQLDTTGKVPGPGLLTPEEQKKVDAYSKQSLVDKLKRLEE